MKKDLERFYTLIAALAESPGQGMLLSECSGLVRWPQRGVYFFMEPGEYRTREPQQQRIIRVGTHAVSTGSKTTLWQRLRAHRGSKDGRGNHRASIFHRHAGAAMIARDAVCDARLSQWGHGGSASRDIRAMEAEHEKSVSAYLGSMRVLWIEVADEPGVVSDRAFIERNAIALLSRQCNPVDPPGKEWLGKFSPAVEIRSSGLWNGNHVCDRYAAALIERFAAFVDRTITRTREDCGSASTIIQVGGGLRASIGNS
ncbi:MAG TPA: hypothetical protein PK916_13370 [Bacteroidota bacterium]|nr:hypothetical protein [Bacteroidota bacterium]